MAVKYITVTPVTNMFKPATRSFGDMAIVGAANDTDTTLTAQEVADITDGVTNLNQLKSRLRSEYPKSEDVNAFFTANNIQTVNDFQQSGVNFICDRKAEGPFNVPVPITNPDDVGDGESVDSPAWFNGDLGTSIRTAFKQTPGPSKIWAVCTRSSQGSAPLADALGEVAKLTVQIVVLANTPLTSTAGEADIEALAEHVDTVSNTGGDGKERIGVAMLGMEADGTINPALITSSMYIDRMTMVAHRSQDEDAAAAVAGTIAGYEPHISLLLKQVKIDMDDLFTDSEIDAFNTVRVNWLTDPSLLPGRGIFMGEGYTLGTDLPYIDVVRTIDDISFRLKARLIRSIGKLRVSRSGLRALVSQITAVLEPLRQREVIEGYDVFFPLLVLLDKDPSSLTPTELQQISNAQNDRTVQAIVSVDYAGAIHRLNITLKFE